MPNACRSRANTIAFELTAAHTVHANSRSSHCSGVGSVVVTTHHADRSMVTGSAVCTSRPPSTGRMSSVRGPGGSADSTRRLVLAVRLASASSAYAGATTTSVNTGASAVASPSGTARLRATMPPNALTGSQAWARWYAVVMSSATATPQGLACLTITQAGSANWWTRRHAASASNRLR